MIILKNNNMITGLTTAAGVWTTATIGVALGYGYYVGAVTVTVFFLSTIILFARFERKRKSAEVIYVEIDDAYKVNASEKTGKCHTGELYLSDLCTQKRHKRTCGTECRH